MSGNELNTLDALLNLMHMNRMFSWDLFLLACIPTNSLKLHRAQMAV